MNRRNMLCGDKETFSEKVLKFNEKLAHKEVKLPEGFRVVNPYSGNQKELVREVATAFYQKYYNDLRSRRLILGSSPARRGSAITGIPFADAQHLQRETGILMDKFCINRPAGDFLYDVISKYGGCERFYADFFMSFVCPLGIAKTNAKGKEVNCNYYENKNLQEALYSFMVSSMRSQIDLGVDRSVCYCIGSGENYKFLSEVNERYQFFNTIVPLEHPRFIMQYNSKNKEFFITKYINALSSNL